ncbi:MAG TPA: Hsp20/alpha crystallin family protein [Acidimicrobiales bacterium]|nr:Hsp20/alpha crystallin family protein [Acidimicrobiales bacterium]
MLVRSDPFRQFDRLAEQVFGTVARPAAMPMDAWRQGHDFVVEFDLPGIDPASIDLDVERNVLTVRAERKPSTGPDVELVASERPRGVFSRQVILGDALDTDGITAAYTGGVLRLTIPVAERAKPRKIAISTDDQDAIGETADRQVISTTAEDRPRVAV